MKQLIILSIISVLIIFNFIIYPFAEFDSDSNNIHHYIKDETKFSVYSFINVIISFLVLLLFFMSLFGKKKQKG
jgi:Na+/H+ antiporter NhaC